MTSHSESEYDLRAPFRVVLDRSNLCICPTLRNASRAVREHITARGWGNREWSACRQAGRVTDVDGQIVGTISYNGRCWAPDGSEITFDAPATA